jgi:nucleotide-binding universal stress UspA family protein
MSEQILVAVAHSAAGLAAARAAVSLAVKLGAELRALHVLEDGETSTLIRAASTEGELTHRRDIAAVAVLRFVADLASREGVPVQLVQRDGAIARSILAEADACAADVIVLGRSVRHGTGAPSVGDNAQQVLELAQQPVLVVPARVHVVKPGGAPAPQR